MKAESQTHKMDMRWKGTWTKTRTRGTQGSSSLVHAMPLCSPTSRCSQSSVAWRGTGRGLGAKAGLRRASLGPRGQCWPAAPTCSAVERGRVTPSGSASPASGEVRASRLPFQSFVARLCLQSRGGGPRTGARGHGLGTEIEVLGLRYCGIVDSHPVQLRRRFGVGADREGEGPLRIRQRVPAPWTCSLLNWGKSEETKQGPWRRRLHSQQPGNPVTLVPPRCFPDTSEGQELTAG